MSDAELEAAVAEKVAGYRWATHDAASGTHWLQLPGAILPQGWKYADGDYLPKKNQSVLGCPKYLTDANAVLALLEKHLWECWVHENGDYSVRLSQTSPTTRTKGFCRAACLALLKAHGHDCGKEGV